MSLFSLLLGSRIKIKSLAPSVKKAKLKQYSCHGWMRLCMRIVKVGLSFFPDTQTSKVRDFLKK